MRKTTAAAKRKAKSDGETPEMRIEMWPIDRPIDYPKNARKWSQAAIDKVTTSLREFGFRQPIVVDKHDVIIIGHLRRVAARAAGFTQVPVHVADLPAGKVRQLRLMDNRSHDEAQWDLDVLAEEMAELAKLDLDLSFTGFDEKEYAPLSTVGGLTDPDEIPPVLAAPVSVYGDLWLMAEHRVLCGDSTDDGAVIRLMDGGSESAIVTDPPYGVGVDYGAFEDSPGNVAGLIVKIMPRVLEAPCAVFTPGIPSMWLYPQPAWVMAWVHPAPSSGCPWGFAGVNPILAYGKDPYLKAGLGRRPDSLVSASDRQGVEGHPTPKPMNVWRWLVERVTTESGQVVLDVFGGSGTTLIACQSLARVARLMEIYPQYVDVIVTRWQNFTGKAATLDGDGRTFAEIAAERVA